MTSENSKRNLVIADNLTHAKATIAWLKLDEDLWETNVYGGKITEVYDRVIMARPLEGITDDYIGWIIMKLVPMVKSVNNITAMHWSYHEMYYDDSQIPE